MPIDPSIPASAFSNRPLAGLGDMYEQQRTQAQTREIEARTRAVDQRAQEEQRQSVEGQAKQQQLEAIWKEWGTKDVKRAVALTYTIDPDSAAKIDEQIAKSAKEWAAGFSIEQDNKRKQTKHFAGLIATAPTPEVLAAVKQQWAAIDPEDAAPFASIVDPKDPAMKGVLEMAMQAEKVYEGRAKAAEFIQKSQGEGAFVQGIAQLLAVTPKDFWDETLNGAGPLLGEFQRHAMEAMSPDQMRQLAMGQTEVVKTGETQRTNMAREAETARENNMQNAATLRGQNIDATIARERIAAGGAGGGSSGGAKSGAGWSEKLDPALANAADGAMLTMPGIRRPPVVALINRLAESGNTDEVKRVVRQAAVEGEPVDTRRQIEGRGNAAAAIQDIKQSLMDLKAAGVNTNILRGGAEDVARKLGTSTDTRLATLGVQIEDALIEYRRSMTGVQFSDREAAEYRQLFPDYRNTLPLNLAVLDGLGKAFTTRDRVYWERKLGPSGAVLVGALQPKTAGPSSNGAATNPTANATPNTTPIGGDAKFEVRAPNGKTYVFKTQAEVDAFKKRAGIP